MLKIGEVAKKTGVSIRSLRHYDEIELLTPSGQTDGGYRLYSEDDIMRLQQIVSLKQMGFTLKKIQSLLDDDSVSLQATLEMQVEFLAEQLKKQKTVYERVEQTLKTCVAKNRVSLEEVYQTMEAMKMLEKYYTASQRQILQKRFKLHSHQAQEYSDAWDEVFQGLAKLYPPPSKLRFSIFNICPKGNHFSLTISRYCSQKMLSLGANIVAINLAS